MMRFRRRLIVTSIAPLAAASLLVSGCGGGSNSPGSSNASASGGSPAQIQQDEMNFAGCIRSHGLAGYPDPVVSSSANHLQVTISPGSLDPNSPGFRSADRACHHYLPNAGVQGSPGGSGTQQQAQDVVFADCMRSHGVPSFPDPDHDGVFTLPARINEQAPAFRSATQACQKVQPSSLSIYQST